MATGTQQMTAEEFARLPHDRQRHELIRGELRSMPPPGAEHAAMNYRIGVPLALHVQKERLGLLFGEGGFLLSRDPDTVVAPDIAFVTQQRLDQFGLPKTYFPAPPDLAIEIVSPNDTYIEVDEKVELYLASGTRLVWVVNPRRRTVVVHAPGRLPLTLKATDVLDGEDVVPGFRATVADMFFS